MDHIYLSSQRWGHGCGRMPQLAKRFAKLDRVFYVEPPRFDRSSGRPELEWRMFGSKLCVCTPHLGEEISAAEASRQERGLLAHSLLCRSVKPEVLWLDSAAAFRNADQFGAAVTVYDRGTHAPGFASRDDATLERTLLQRAQLVFAADDAGARELRALGAYVHSYPDGVDVELFARARHRGLHEAEDQAPLAKLRLGVLGALDQLDLDLVARVARVRPEWQFVMLGAPASSEGLPCAKNVHWLGARACFELPSYLVGWDVALLPCAQTPAAERASSGAVLRYLAAGKPVVSTIEPEVLKPHDARGMIRVVEPEDFALAIEQALHGRYEDQLQAADDCVAALSWDATAARMRSLIAHAMPERAASVARALSAEPTHRALPA